MATLSQSMPASTRFPLAPEPKTGLSTTHIAGMLSAFPLFPSPNNGIKSALSRGGEDKILSRVFAFIPRPQCKQTKPRSQVSPVDGSDSSSTSSDTGSTPGCSTAPTTPPTSPSDTNTNSGSGGKRKRGPEAPASEPVRKRQGIQAEQGLNGKEVNVSLEEKLIKSMSQGANETSENKKKRKNETPDNREAQKKRRNDWKPSGSKVKGLNNQSNYCYRNSVLQFLASCNGFLQRLATHQQQCKSSRCAACTLAEFFGEHFYDSGRSTPNQRLKLVHNLRKDLGSPFTSPSQQDASEYLRELLTLTEKCLTKGMKDSEKKKRNDEVHRSFGGSYKTTVTCPRCKHESSGAPEICPDLHIHPGGTRNGMKLVDMIAKHFGKEEVEYTCEKCKFKNNYFLKQQVMVKGPEFLTIHLARHQNAIFSRGRIQARKSMQRLDFPKILSVGAHRYRLKSLVAHAGGSMNSGHYVAFVRQPSGEWAECNDDYISQVDEKYALNSGNGSCQISILGYERSD